MRTLIVSADDFGLHEAMNRGVIDAHDHGIVTSASLVPCGRAFDDAAGLALSRPRLDLGIHLTLVEEKPLLEPAVLKTLAPSDRFPANYRALFLDLSAGRIEKPEIELELRAQIERALRAGLTISHLDSHQHAHFFPDLRPIICGLAERYGIRAIRGASRVRPSPTKFSLLLGPLAKGMHRLARARGLVTPDTLWLPSPSGHVGERELIDAIQGLPEGVTELVVHPGSDQRALAEAFPAWGFEWEKELAAVKSLEVKDALNTHGVRLTRYSELE